MFQVLVYKYSCYIIKGCVPKICFKIRYFGTHFNHSNINAGFNVSSQGSVYLQIPDFSVTTGDIKNAYFHSKLLIQTLITFSPSPHYSLPSEDYLVLPVLNTRKEEKVILVTNGVGALGYSWHTE